MFVILDSGLEIRWSKTTGASNLKDQCPILVEAILQLKEPRLLSQKQADEGPRPPDQAVLFF